MTETKVTDFVITYFCFTSMVTHRLLRRIPLINMASYCSKMLLFNLLLLVMHLHKSGCMTRPALIDGQGQRLHNNPNHLGIS